MFDVGGKPSIQRASESLLETEARFMDSGREPGLRIDANGAHDTMC
jgi:hypothetical protein